VDHKNFDRNNNRDTNLEYVTIDENIRRAVEAGVIPSFERFHKNRTQFRWKLTEEQAAEIKVLLAAPDSNMSIIAKQFNVSRELVRQIKIGKLWRAEPIKIDEKTGEIIP
jgi:hypothetical protein